MKNWERLYGRYLALGDARSTERRIELVMMVLAFLLLVQLLLSGFRLTLISEPDAISPSIESFADAALMGVEKVDAAQRDEITARPLFWVSRRPAVGAGAVGEAAETSASGSGSLGEMKILGLFGSGETAGVIAIVEDKKRRVLLGGQLAGWTLKTVRTNQVELSRDGQLKTLFLVPQNTATAPAKTAAPAKPAAPEPARSDKRRTQDAGTTEPVVGDKTRGRASSSKLGWGAVANDND